MNGSGSSDNEKEWGGPIKYHEVLSVRDNETRTELTRMSHVHAQLIHRQKGTASTVNTRRRKPVAAKKEQKETDPVSLESRIFYAVALCRLSFAMCIQPTKLNHPPVCSSVPLWWWHGQHACNCVFFEVLHRSLDAARVFLAHTTQCVPQDLGERRKLINWCRTLIGVLCYVDDMVFETWTDSCSFENDVATHTPYSRDDVHTTREFLRAYACWSTATLLKQTVPESSSSSASSSSLSQEFTSTLEQIAFYFGAAHHIMSQLPRSQPLKDETGDVIETLQNGAAVTVEIPSLSDPKLKTAPATTMPAKLDPSVRTWSNGVHLDLLLAAAKWYWSIHTGKSVMLFRLAFHNGDSFVEEKWLKEREKLHATSLAKFQEKPEATEWHNLLSTALHFQQEADELFVCGCPPMPPLLAASKDTEKKTTKSTEACVLFRCGERAFFHRLESTSFSSSA